MFANDLGLDESGVSRLIQSTPWPLYILYGVRRKFAPGLAAKGFTAPQAAGVIPPILKKVHIRAQVIKYDDFIKYGSEAACKGEWETKVLKEKTYTWRRRYAFQIYLASKSGDFISLKEYKNWA